MKKDFQCDFNYKLIYLLLLAACLLSKAKLRLSVHRAIKPQRQLLQPSLKALQLLLKILRTLLNQQQPVVGANELVDVVDIKKVADAEAELMTVASRPAQPYKASFQYCQSAPRAILLGAWTTYLRCSHRLAVTHRQSVKLSDVHC